MIIPEIPTFVAGTEQNDFHTRITPLYRDMAVNGTFVLTVNVNRLVWQQWHDIRQGQFTSKLFTLFWQTSLQLPVIIFNIYFTVLKTYGGLEKMNIFRQSHVSLHQCVV